MSLLNNTKPEAGAGAGAGATTEVVAPKKSNSEYQKKQRELAKKYGAQLKDFYKGNIPAEIKEAVEFFSREKKAGAGKATPGKPVFYRIFGDNPKIGDKKTALEVFESVGKGYGEMRQLMKKWEDKQKITVTFDEKTKSYTISAGTIEAYTAE